MKSSLIVMLPLLFATQSFAAAPCDAISAAGQTAEGNCADEAVAKTEKLVTESLPSPRGLPTLQSSAVLIVDQESGAVLYSKNSEARMSIASITKLMTAMVTLDAHLPLQQIITISNADIDQLRNTSSRLKVGVDLTRRQLLQLALMSSENRAAFALARSYPGGMPAFVMAMNRKAASLQMKNTYFADPTGLHSENKSTAEDLVKMVNAGYQYELIRDITTTAAYDLPSHKRARALAYKNTNMLVKNKEWHIGLSKTGFINEAGHCLVMQASIAKQRLVIVLLDSFGKYTRIGDANRIKKWIESSMSARRRLG